MNGIGRFISGRRIFGDFAWLSFSQFNILAARLVGVRLLTELLPASTFGELGLAIAATTLGVAVLASPIIQAAMRQFHEAASNGELTILRREGLLLTGGAWLLFSAIFAVTVFQLVPADDYSPVIVWIAVISLAGIDMVKAFEVGLLNAGHRQKIFSAWNAADAWARPLFACAFIVIAGAAMTNAISGNIAGALLAGAAFWRWRIRAKPGDENPGSGIAYRRALVSVAWPLVPFSLCAWFTGIADRFALGALDGTAAVGIYIAAYGLASAPFLSLSNVLMNVFRPRIFSAHARADERHAVRTMRAWLLAFGSAGACGLGLLWWLREPIVGIVLARDFASAAAIVPIIALGYLVQGLEVVFDTYLLSLKRTRVLLYVQLVGAVVAAVGYVLLIPQYGYFGAASATLLAQATSCALAITAFVRLHTARGLQGESVRTET